ncbi:hypothetical protein M430DRAFT_212382 [Amorphotheca resinae ATCC 22711]|uniref:Uncharacterized protein n=1 Tax=Amorphotheca resinae ATCC 22711 TaxID=857342 RepID=A0A2T3B878_AMORE|nr:hypothetical protein M430DRAFT_212382 [Amorphotheca resinae ATCC 22711]PSS23032.1 hypothetical protein M430DRAFT_212382 [Amorphotheca resinae ATCC 22711]
MLAAIAEQSSAVGASSASLTSIIRSALRFVGLCSRGGWGSEEGGPGSLRQAPWQSGRSYISSGHMIPYRNAYADPTDRRRLLLLKPHHTPPRVPDCSARTSRIPVTSIDLTRCDPSHVCSQNSTVSSLRRSRGVTGRILEAPEIGLLRRKRRRRI